MTKAQKRFELIEYYLRDVVVPTKVSVEEAVRGVDLLMAYWPEEPEHPTKEFTDGFETGVDVGEIIYKQDKPTAKELLTKMETQLANVEGQSGWEIYNWARREVYGE